MNRHHRTKQSSRLTQGLVLSSHRVHSLVPRRLFRRLLRAHTAGTWGDIAPVQRYRNDFALRFGGTVISRFSTEVKINDRLCFVTSIEKSATFVFFESDCV